MNDPIYNFNQLLLLHLNLLFHQKIIIIKDKNRDIAGVTVKHTSPPHLRSGFDSQAVYFFIFFLKK